MVSILKWSSISLEEIYKAKTRLEASVYRIEARAARKAIHDCKCGYQRLSDGKNGLVSNAYYPGRFKRVYVSKDNGLPMVMPSQMLAVKPRATKYISAKMYKNVDSLLLKEGTLLISRSGTIGNCTIVSKTLKGKTMSDDVIRVEFFKDYDLGYVYAYLRTITGHLILSTNNYGSVIKHIEPEHLEEVDIPNAPENIRKQIDKKIRASFELRDQGNVFIENAEAILFRELGLPPIERVKPIYFKNNSEIKAFNISLNDSDNRLDGSYHIPIVDKIMDYLLDNAKEILPLSDNRLTSNIIMAGRFKRNYVEEEEGIVFLGGKQIHELDPTNKKFLSRKLHGARIDDQLFLKENMIAVTCSGTVGRVNIIPKHWENWAMSQHVLRAIPTSNEIAGYLYVWLNSDYGRALIERFVYGAVIDEIDDNHLGNVAIPLIKDKYMKEISDLALHANKLRSQAYYLEQEAISIMNDEIIFTAKKKSNNGLSDAELIGKYEAGEIKLGGMAKKMIKKKP